MDKVISNFATEDSAREQFHAQRRRHWDKVARTGELGALSANYRTWLRKTYGYLVPPGMRVCEVGCGAGDLLAALKPSFGLGVDFSSAQLDRARASHPELAWAECDAHDLGAVADLGPFDVIILSDLVNELWDVQRVLHEVGRLCAPHTRVIINFYSHLWEWPLRLAQRLGLASRRLEQNWLTPSDLTGMLDLADLEPLRLTDGFFWPLRTPLLEPLCNRFLAHLWPFKALTLSHVLTCRPRACGQQPLKVSVIIPARNEAGNIAAAIARTPQMGAGTELVFVEGNSTDNTWETIQRLVASHPELECRAYQQPGKGKGDAVRLGFAKATGDVLMILDADLTVPPEVLPVFYEAIRSGKAEFANGVRLVYPQDKKAMRFCNLLANKFFSLAFTWLLGVSIKDTLCGTKVLSRESYARIAANRHYFGEFDPFGDYDLIFGAAKLNLKIMDIPVRYRERTYGDTNISRWRDGWLLLRMVAFAARRIKFL
ncbi:MAG: glycosyltransferase [Proteobacteria bacterium]|nr:glycosyltransferase [Pseudomonadota bacterium]MBU1593906.1 glycosyltransferase [Pseudomonadota bacterium]